MATAPGLGRGLGQPRRIEIVLHRLDDDIYLSGMPAEKAGDWLVNLSSNPDFVFHLKHDVVADLPATATGGDRPRPSDDASVPAVFVDQFNDRHGPVREWPVDVLDAWVEHSPLAR